MRKLLLLALLLYDIASIVTGTDGYDYEELDGAKRHSMIEDRKNWRKKILLRPGDLDNDYDLRKGQQVFDNTRSFDDQEQKLFRGIDRRSHKKRYEDSDKGMKSEELMHSTANMDEKKSIAVRCDRQHERYESCFAGCAAISCDNPRERLQPCYPFCEPGCVCASPYVRDDRTHKCVRPDECSKGLKGIPDLAEDA